MLTGTASVSTATTESYTCDIIDVGMSSELRSENVNLSRGDGGKRKMFVTLVALPTALIATCVVGILGGGCRPLADPPEPTDEPTVMYTVILPPEGAASPDGGIYDNN